MKRLIILLFLCSSAFGQYNGIKPMLGKQIDWSHPLTNGLVGCWLMNEGSGDIIQDLSGNGNTGSFVADTHFVPGKFGPALNFDGTGDYVKCGLMPAVEGIGALTVSCWVKVPGTPASTQMIVSKRGEANDRCFYLHVRSSTTVFFGVYDSGDGESLAQKTNALVPGTWNHIVGVYDGANVRVYADTIPGADVVQTGVTDASTQELAIGADKGDVGGDNWLGQIDNVKIWNRALSASEVALDYREPFCMFKEDLPVSMMYSYAVGVVVTPYYYRGLLFIPIIPFSLYLWRRKCAA